MNTLYVIHLSSGLPRQRVFRSHQTVVCTGSTRKAAEAAAVGYVGHTRDFPPGYTARVETSEAICTTPDHVLTGAIL